MTKLNSLLLAALVLVAGLSGASRAKAFAINGTTITTIMVIGGTGAAQYAFIGFATAVPGSTCIAKAGMLVDVTTAKGKAAFSLATAALLSHVMVDAAGTSACVTPQNGFSTEVLSTLNVHNQ